MSEDWRALGAEAARFLREGRWPDAIELLTQLLDIRPDHADSWFNLGYAQRQARHYDAALEAYQKALDLGIAGAEEVHLNRAVILSEHLHQSDPAEAELKRAIAANPGFTAAWLNLGNLREDLGDRESARNAYESALSVSPGNGRALARIGAMMAQAGDPASAVAFLQRAVASTHQGGEGSAELAFALGNACDAAGDYRKAFAAVSNGNLLAAAIREPAQRYDPQAQEQLVNDLICAFPNPANPTGAELPVTFICGMFRSGSTLIEQMLARHPGVTPGGELEFIPAIVAEDLRPYPASVAALEADQIGRLRQSYLDQVSALFAGADLVTDKRPDNFLHIGLIKLLFPRARLIHTVRNPLDNLLSAYFLYFGDSIAYSDRLDDLVHYYAQYRRLMDHWQSLYGSDIFAVDYDQLVSDPRMVMQPLLEFLGLEWQEACLHQQPASSPVRTASVWQVRKPLHRQSSGRWRNYETELAPVRARLQALGLIGPDGA